MDMMEYRTSDQKLNVFHDCTETCVSIEVCLKTLICPLKYISCCVGEEERVSSK